MPLGGDESVDYLVFGVGFGSSLVLLGWLLRQFGPTFRYRTKGDESSEVLSAEELIARQDWRTFCMAVGAILSVSGALMLFVTVVTLLLRPADSTGSVIVGVVFVLTLLGIAGWIALFVSQHENIGGFADLARMNWKPRIPRLASGSKDAADGDHDDPDADLDQDDFGFPAAPASPPVPARTPTAQDPSPTPTRRIVNPARPSNRPIAATRPKPGTQATPRPPQTSSAASQPATNAPASQNEDENLLAGVRFSRPRSATPNERQQATSSPAPREQTPQPARSEPQSQPPVSPSPRQRTPVVGDDVVSSVTMKDAGEDDPSATSEMPRSRQAPARETSSSEASSREAALANLRLRRAGRPDSRDS
ncbi:MAG TPA: hypothetical protein VFQ54_11945 [Thermomicrobiales bacterium]|nr:hypothetical protein [Thermomicrobiales bacterium]